MRKRNNIIEKETVLIININELNGPEKKSVSLNKLMKSNMTFTNDTFKIQKFINDESKGMGKPGKTKY